MTFSPITVRPAEASDVDALVALGTASCLSSIDQLPEFRGRKAEMQPAFAAFIAEDWPRILVAEQHSKLLGFVSPDIKTGEITDLWIDPSEQGRGWGGVLLASAEAQIRQNGHSCTWLTTHHQKSGALRFYRTQGYALLNIAEAAGETLPDVTYPRALLGKQLSRPNAAAAHTMHDVRVGIDTLDPILLALVAERFAFIDRAAALKPDLAMPANDRGRVEAVVASARKQAKSIGFDADLTERLWRTMIDLAIAREEVAMAPRADAETQKAAS